MPDGGPVTPRVMAVIPAKGRSRRVPGKNMRPFCGRPLLAYTIEAALGSARVDDVYVSTESEEIGRFAESLGAKVPCLRPAELSGDDVHGSVPIIHMLEHVGGAKRYGYVVQLLATSPFKSSATIDAIVDRSVRDHRNVLSVTPTGRMLLHFRELAADGTIRTVGGASGVNFQAESAPALYALNGAIYCAPSEHLLRHRTFQYGSPIGFPMDPLEAFDIDTEREFQMAEQMAPLALAARRSADRRNRPESEAGRRPAGENDAHLPDR